MRFLLACFRKLIDWSKSKFGSRTRAERFSIPPHLPVVPDEPLARFFVSMSKVKASTKKLRPEAFVPHPYRETSVFRIRELISTETRDLGQIEFADRLEEPKPLFGWGKFNEDVLHEQSIGLRLAEWKAEDKAHSRHRDVIGWPEVPNDPKETKAKQKEIALELSEHTVVIMAETGQPM